MDALDQYCAGLSAELPTLEQDIAASCQVGRGAGRCRAAAHSPGLGAAAASAWLRPGLGRAALS
jgi:hypothetical protein